MEATATASDGDVILDNPRAGLTFPMCFASYCALIVRDICSQNNSVGGLSVRDVRAKSLCVRCNTQAIWPASPCVHTHALCVSECSQTTKASSLNYKRLCLGVCVCHITSFHHYNEPATVVTQI